MTRKLLIVPWFGPLPAWYDHWARNARRLMDHGYDIQWLDELDGFRGLCRERLGVDAPIVSGGSKIHDYRATFGVLFEDILEGYEFWGHTDLDVVYGRVENWVTDDFLASVDLHSNHDTYVCGPWSLYRNTPTVNNLFREVANWRDILEAPKTTGWVETAFSRTAEQVLDGRLAYTYWQTRNLDSFDDLWWDGDRLMEEDQEVMMAHFRRLSPKVYPEQLIR